ncbi:MAG: ROK family protein [Phycisphaerales bacterium]
MNTTVGVDLGGTHMQVGVLDESRKLIGRSSAKTHAERGPQAVLDTIAEHVKLAMHDAGVKRVDAIGLAAPGAVDHEQGIVIDAPNLNWDDLPAAHLLEERLGTPVILDNDVNAAVYAEQRLGAGRGHDNLMGVWIGTGIGGGIIIGGSVYHGQRRTAGEIGHVLIDPNNPHRRRELEHQCSRTAIARDIADRIKEGADSRLKKFVDEGVPIPSSEIANALDAGDKVTAEVVEIACGKIGNVVGSIVTLLSLGRIVVGGGLVEEAGRHIVEPIEKAARASCWPDSLKNLEVVPTMLGPNAGLTGAALLAARRIGETS